MTPQLLEMIVGRRSQIAVRRRIVDHLELAEQAIAEVGLPNVKIQLDLYHCQVTEGDLLTVTLSVRDGA